MKRMYRAQAPRIGAEDAGLPIEQSLTDEDLLLLYLTRVARRISETGASTGFDARLANLAGNFYQSLADLCREIGNQENTARVAAKVDEGSGGKREPLESVGPSAQESARSTRRRSNK